MEGTFISNKYKNLDNIYSFIIESEEEINKIKKEKSDYLKYIHCNGCYRKCPLTNAYCGRGKNTKIKFEQM